MNEVKIGRSENQNAVTATVSISALEILQNTDPEALSNLIEARLSFAREKLYADLRREPKQPECN